MVSTRSRDYESPEQSVSSGAPKANKRTPHEGESRPSQTRYFSVCTGFVLCGLAISLCINCYLVLIQTEAHLQPEAVKTNVRLLRWAQDDVAVQKSAIANATVKTAKLEDQLAKNRAISRGFTYIDLNAENERVFSRIDQLGREQLDSLTCTLATGTSFVFGFQAGYYSHYALRPTLAPVLSLVVDAEIQAPVQTSTADIGVGATAEEMANEFVHMRHMRTMNELGL